MKKLNKKGVSLGETMAAITVLGIVLGVALTTVNSRAKQLNIINTEMVALFELTDDSNRYYIQNNTPNDTPVLLPGKNSYHILNTGKLLKENNNIQPEVLNDIKNDPKIIDNEEYLLSYIEKNNRWYHIIRLTTYTPSINVNEVLFPKNPKGVSEDLLPVKKDNNQTVSNLMSNEYNMPNSHIVELKKSINTSLETIRKKQAPSGSQIPTENQLYNKTIFEDGSNEQLSTNRPASVVINDISPLTLQLKMYTPKETINSNGNEGELVEIQFFSLVDYNFNLSRSKKATKQVKIYGKFDANFIKGNSEKYIPDKLVGISPISYINQSESYFRERFWDENNIEKFNNTALNKNAINITTNPTSPLLLEDYIGPLNEERIGLTIDVIGKEIVDYINTQLAGGQNFNA